MATISQGLVDDTRLFENRYNEILNTTLILNATYACPFRLLLKASSERFIIFNNISPELSK